MLHNHSESKVTLWTRQDIKSLEDLRINGTVRIKEKHLKEKFNIISDYIINLYGWFVCEADKRVPKPADVEYPIWCSISEENMLRPTEDTVVYVLEVDKSEVVYFDGSKWDYVLNHLYIPKDAEDEAAYKKDMEIKGFQNRFSFIDEKTAHFYPAERKQVMDSWERIFEIDVWNIFIVQANIWEIRPDMIREIIHHKASDQSL